jgi:UDP-glucose 6-dehydrogenase
MHIAMIGSGYVGLVSGACLADFGHNVICVDKDAEKISALQQGECPIFEPGLSDLIAGNRRAGRLSFTSELKMQSARRRRSSLQLVRRHDAGMGTQIFRTSTQLRERSPPLLTASQ